MFRLPWSLGFLIRTWFCILALSSLFRLAFLFLYYDRLADTSLGVILQSLLHGIRFDAAIVLTVTGIPATIWYALSITRWRRAAFRIYLAFISIVGALMVVMLVVDMGYYQYVDRRISFEVAEMLADWRVVTRMIFLGFPFQALVTFLVLGVAVYLYWRTMNQHYRELLEKTHILQHGIKVLVLFAVIVIGARGGTQSKPLSVNMAFPSGHLVAGHLALNPGFTVYRSLVLKKRIPYAFMSDEKAVASTRKVLGLNDPPEQEEFPLYRSIPESSGQRTPKNLVMIVMESFSAQFVQAITGKPDELGELTPHFNALSQEGLLYTRFYSSGTRSLEAVGTLLSGFPNLPNMKLVGTDLEQNTLISLPLLLKQNEYYSLFLHGAFRGSMRFDAFAKRNGFDKYIAKEDFPDYEKKSDSYWGVFDHYAFERLDEELQKANRPTFAFFFSLSSHTPFELPDESFRTFPEDSPNAGVRNSIAYADRSLGRFFERARKSAYWKDTIFVITADHNMGQHTMGGPDKMHIPLLILSPGDPTFPRGETRDWIGGQVDVAPTVVDVLGLDGHHSFAGRSLWQPAVNRFALFGWGNQTAWLDEQGLLVHGSEKILAFSRFQEGVLEPQKSLETSDKVLSDTNQKLEAYIQTWANLMLRNRLAPVKSTKLNVAVDAQTESGSNTQ